MTRVRAAIIVLAAVHCCIVFAGFIAPYSGEQQDRDHSFAPPSKLRLRNAEGRVVRPCIYRLQIQEGLFDTYAEDRSHCETVHFFCGRRALQVSWDHPRQTTSVWRE